MEGREEDSVEFEAVEVAVAGTERREEMEDERERASFPSSMVLSKRSRLVSIDEDLG